MSDATPAGTTGDPGKLGDAIEKVAQHPLPPDRATLFSSLSHSAASPNVRLPSLRRSE